MYLYIQLLLLTGSMVLSTQGQSMEPPPNFGDMRLNKFEMLDGEAVSGEPQVFCTDGSMSPTWSYICSSKSTKMECAVMCNQIGYETCSMIQSRTANESDIVWITGVACDANSTHIFHCAHTIKFNSTPCSGEHPNGIIKITCEKPLLKPSEPYAGQVTLCPSDYQANQQYRTQSVSTGIVSIFLHNQWGALSYYDDGRKPLTDRISRYHGNLICQQMGFQQVVPGSIRTKAAYEASGYTFDKCSNRDSTKENIHLPWTWVTTSNLSCEAKNYNDLGYTATDDDPCFGCCYIQPPNNFEGPETSFIVLQCMYESFTGKKGTEDKVPYGSQKKCSFQDKQEGGNRIIQYNSVCAAGSHRDDLTNWAITSPFLILILLVLLGVAVMYIIVYKGKHNHSDEEARLQPNSEN